MNVTWLGRGLSGREGNRRGCHLLRTPRDAQPWRTWHHPLRMDRNHGPPSMSGVRDPWYSQLMYRSNFLHPLRYPIYSTLRTHFVPFGHFPPKRFWFCSHGTPAVLHETLKINIWTFHSLAMPCWSKHIFRYFIPVSHLEWKVGGCGQGKRKAFKRAAVKRERK